MTDINQKQLDRLVDGELTDGERRQLLDSFEQNTDGWRQCACAFLEAQEFNAALNGMMAPATSTDNVATTPKDSESSYDGASFRWWAALAACLAIGVAIGQMNTTGVGSATLSMPSIAASDSEGSSSTDTSQMIAADAATNRSLVSPNLDQQYSVVPNDIEDILGRLGQRVERRRIYTPAGTTDPSALPVEEIEIVPVRWDTY